ncbi:hypothetical protein C6P45_004378 [Maudiozyma exigua]|uniref:Uncharacterized protein n=1 Tax=Maudiozyma exigua TaxID=34358 RepID=A0A9P6WAW3_MAUEX|nr:hypothetical protein C6P45_004378 [Kazachstania exigua]
MVRRSTTTYYPIVSRSKSIIKRACTTSSDLNDISDLKRDIFKLSLYNKDTELINKAQGGDRDVSAENNSSEDVESPEIMNKQNKVTNSFTQTPNNEEENVIEKGTICVSDVAEDYSIQEGSYIEIKMEQNDQLDNETTLISNNLIEHDDVEEEEVSYNVDLTVKGTELKDITGISPYKSTSKKVVSESGTYRSIHKPLKELIYQTNMKLYDVDSRKVQYRAGLSKSVSCIPSLHPKKTQN